MHPYTLSKAMGAGLLGTLGQTMLVYGVAPLLLGRSMDLAAMLGHTCPLGLLMHVLSGSVGFPLGYVCLVSSGFPGPPVLKGMLWAGLLWGVAECIMAPLLGAGVSSAALGGLPAALLALLGYLVYGATLGGIVGTARPCPPGAGERQTIPSNGTAPPNVHAGAMGLNGERSVSSWQPRNNATMPRLDGALSGGRLCPSSHCRSRPIGRLWCSCAPCLPGPRSPGTDASSMWSHGR
jgi:Family of unknown function (DUF6789)